MNVYQVTGFSLVPGDVAYVEAVGELSAVARLLLELKEISLSDPPPVTAWTVVAVRQPLCVIWWRE